jgi:exodeoxyribonuclease III
MPADFGEASISSYPTDRTVEIWTWNIDGVNARINKNELQSFIKSAQPDILCLNETKIDLDKIRSKKFY